MAFTQLSPLALPGSRYSFSAKTEAEAGLKGKGPFTELSVLGLPGRIHSFDAKSITEAGEKGEGQFTWLSPYGGPGRRYSFSAKVEAEAVRGGVTRIMPSARLVPWVDEDKDLDRDVLEFLAIITVSGTLNRI